MGFIQIYYILTSYNLTLIIIEACEKRKLIMGYVFDPFLKISSPNDFEFWEILKFILIYTNVQLSWYHKYVHSIKNNQVYIFNEFML